MKTWLFLIYIYTIIYVYNRIYIYIIIYISSCVRIGFPGCDMVSPLVSSSPAWNGPNIGGYPTIAGNVARFTSRTLPKLQCWGGITLYLFFDSLIYLFV
jgi:hypothetical protein